MKGEIGVKRKKSKTELEEKKEQGQPVEWEKNNKRQMNISAF